MLNAKPTLSSFDDFDIDAPFKLRKAPPNISTKGIGNNLFGSQASIIQRENDIKKNQEQPEIDDLLYELPETMPELELGDPLLNTLGIEVQSLFDKNTLTKKEEEDEVLQNVLDEYNVEDIKNTMGETGTIPKSIYFFYGGESEEFVRTIEYINASPINREFAAFLISDLGI